MRLLDLEIPIQKVSNFMKQEIDFDKEINRAIDTTDKSFMDHKRYLVSQISQYKEFEITLDGQPVYFSQSGEDVNEVGCVTVVRYKLSKSTHSNSDLEEDVHYKLLRSIALTEYSNIVTSWVRKEGSFNEEYRYVVINTGRYIPNQVKASIKMKYNQNLDLAEQLPETLYPQIEED